MTSRRNRRRRHKRHKARTKNERAMRLLAHWAFLRYRANHPHITLLESLMAMEAAQEGSQEQTR